MPTTQPDIIRECVDIRRKLHAEPELSGEEFRTRDLIVSELRTAGLQVRTFPGSAGVAGLWPGRDGAGCLALRADMDALPIRENSGLPWASRSGRAMHACGHDGHTGILLGVAKHLGRLGASGYPLGVKLVFQPAEESGDGARLMIQEGVLEDPPVEAAFGLHGWPDLPLGTAGVHSGPVMASADNFALTLLGKGGHGALPHHGLDPIFAAAQLISAAQSLVSRSVDPLESAVLTFGHIRGGDTFNVIPDECLLRGTLRTQGSVLRERLKSQFDALRQNLCRGLGLDSRLEWVEGCPATVNDPAMSALARRAAINALGKENCLEPKPSMAGEDFSLFLEKVPGAYLWLGLGRDRGALHNPGFDFNDDALEIGVRLFLAVIEEYQASRR